MKWIDSTTVTLCEWDNSTAAKDVRFNDPLHKEFSLEFLKEIHFRNSRRNSFGDCLRSSFQSSFRNFYRVSLRIPCAILWILVWCLLPLMPARGKAGKGNYTIVVHTPQIPSGFLTWVPPRISFSKNFFRSSRFPTSTRSKLQPLVTEFLQDDFSRNLRRISRKNVWENFSTSELITGKILTNFKITIKIPWRFLQIFRPISERGPEYFGKTNPSKIIPRIPSEYLNNIVLIPRVVLWTKFLTEFPFKSKPKPPAAEAT